MILVEYIQAILLLIIVILTIFETYYVIKYKKEVDELKTKIDELKSIGDMNKSPMTYKG